MAQSTFLDFAREQLPPPPARILDVGCGQGELTTALAVLGYDVTGIDPIAPHGEAFRRILLEDLDPGEEEPFDAVVSSLAFHGMRDLGASFDRVAALLRPRGVLVLQELGWDRADEPTLDWLYNQRRALAAAGQGEAPASLEAMREQWEAEHVGVARYAALREAIDARFEARAFEWAPFLHRLLHGVASEVLETALIEADAIRALGFRYAGFTRNGEGDSTES